MKVALANNLYPPYGRDSGAEIVCQKMATDLEKAGHYVFIITTKAPKEKRPSNDHVYYLSSNYESLNKFSLPRKLIWYFFQLIFPPHQKELDRIIKTEKPDLFISHNLLGLSFALPKILARNKIEHHHVLHDIQLLHPSGLMYLDKESELDKPWSKIYQAYTRKIFKQTKKIISPSNWLLELHHKKKFFSDCLQEVVPNFQLKKIKTKGIGSPVRFLLAGQLENHKGIKLILSAWRASNLSESEAKLSIAGSGSLESYVISEVKKFNNVNYLGHLTRAKMQTALEANDLVILPSLVYENSPTIIWEAAKFGLSAIASDLGGTRELVQYLDLRLFKAGNEEDLIRKMREAIKK